MQEHSSASVGKSRVADEREHFDLLARQEGEVWWGHKTEAGKRRLSRRARVITRALERFADPTVLEIGCGAGALSEALLCERRDLRLLGCDISPASVALAKSRCHLSPRARFVVADVGSVGCPDESCDAVVGNSILHHVDIEPTLKEIARVLKPEGLIWFSEPNMLNPQILVEKNIHTIGKALQNSENETAFLRWPLRRLLGSHGFVDISVRPTDFLHPGVPSMLIGGLDLLGRAIEKVPIVKEISGSLFISAIRGNGIA